MISELDKILIKYDQPDFNDKLNTLFLSTAELSHFGFGENHRENNQKVASILDKVGNEGDQAVCDYTREFDGITLTPNQLRITPEELKTAHQQVVKNNELFFESLRKAIKNVRSYQEDIFIGNKTEVTKYPGIRYTPIERVGICVPGASAPLPSTVVMTVIPAQVAGVKEIVVVSPPRYNGSIHPVILAVCHELNIKEVYRIGGAQAIGALIFGTTKIRQVDKIVGPGNQWVQTAKQLGFGTVDVDSIAGPSEVLIIADDNANPAWIAADMLSQTEHDPGSAILFTLSQKLASAVLIELKKQIKQLGRSKEAESCLSRYGGIVVFREEERLIYNANELAAEHLEIQCGDKSKAVADKIQNAGAIFIGDYSPVAVGDYWAGPSHTLPTGRSARFFSALSANDFVKSTSIIEYDKKKLAESAEDIIRLAEAEGLDAHARSVRIRQQRQS
jgi:histidinol dehydrogenase